MNKHDLRVQKTKESIHQALLILLKEKQLASIKITELCQLAQINRGTFYFHYVEVSDVFQEFFEEMIEDLRISYDEPYRQTPELEIRNLDPKTVRLFHHVKKYEQFYRIILSRDVSIKYYYMLFDEIKNNCMNDIRTFQTINENHFFYSYSANAIIGLIIEWSRRDFKDTVEEMNVQLVNILKIQHSI